MGCGSNYYSSQVFSLLWKKAEKLFEANSALSNNVITENVITENVITEKARRYPVIGIFVATSALVLALGCTPKYSNKSKSASLAQSSDELARRTIVSSEGSSGYDLQLVETAEISKLEIALNSDSQSAPSISTLDNPPRLVLDLEGSYGPQTSAIDTPESLFIDRIRVAEHPGKSRVVLDLNSNSKVETDLSQGLPGQYILTLTQLGADSSKATSATTEAAEIAMNESSRAKPTNEFLIAEANIDSTAKDSKQNKEQLAEFSLPQAEKVALTDEVTVLEGEKEEFLDLELANTETAKNLKSETASSNNAKILSYQLQSISPRDNTLIIEGSNLKDFNLKRTAPSEYVLSMPSTLLGEEAKDTLVAPAGSGAIRSVRSRAQGSSSELRIFIDPERDLQAELGDTGVVISASTGEMDSSAVKAQATDEVLGTELSIDDEIAALLGDKPKYSGRLISLDLQDTDIDNALRIIAEVSNLNIIASEEVTGKITLRLVDVPWDQALDVILKTNGLDMIQENNVVRIAPVEKMVAEREALKQARQAEEDLEPLSVRYVRISYAKAAELKPLVESVLSERGATVYDERTNQLIVKDIKKGIVNVAELIAKLDLRTPQVLLETQIVEATTTLARDLGSEFGFNYVQSPATGNATGYNFPNSVSIGGSGPNGNFSSFAGDDSSAITMLLESADGTRSLATRLTALESEGKVKVVSRPAVATTNNKQATIRSVETIRIRAPDGGLSVATGQGAQASGTGSSTEEVEIGIVLEVTPQASPDYYVLLDINAKSSTLGSTVVDGIPSEIERSATSSVLVSSGQTFAMGGIYKTTDSNTIDGVPFLKDIPVLGHFFRRSLLNSQDEELLFFITPRIIEGSFDDAAMKAS
jgi:type IV pilus secretin PilQ/predicted competence protein